MVDKFLTTEDVADMCRVAPGTVENWRYKSMGPAYIKVGGSVRYRQRAVEAYLNAQTKAA